MPNRTTIRNQPHLNCSQWSLPVPPEVRKNSSNCRCRHGYFCSVMLLFSWTEFVFIQEKSRLFFISLHTPIICELFPFTIVVESFRVDVIKTPIVALIFRNSFYVHLWYPCLTSIVSQYYINKDHIWILMYKVIS